MGEYIPKAPIDEKAKKYNQNLPGMGGVFNHINGNLYHYAGNNPVRYIDPTGKWSLAIGWTSSAGAGAQVGITTGIVIAFSKKHGLSFGTFDSESIGSEFGFGANTGLKLSFDYDSEKVKSEVTKSVDVGGSAPVGAGIVGVGGEGSVDLETGNATATMSVTVGPGSPEGHVTYSTTHTENKSDQIEKALTEVNNQLENMYLDYYLENYEYMGF